MRRRSLPLEAPQERGAVIPDLIRDPVSLRKPEVLCRARESLYIYRVPSAVRAAHVHGAMPRLHRPATTVTVRNRLQTIVIWACFFVLGVTAADAQDSRPNVDAAGASRSSVTGKAGMRSNNYGISWTSTTATISRMRSQNFACIAALGQTSAAESRSARYRLQSGFAPAAAKTIRRVRPEPPS